jgi:hypothetical protein
LSQHRCVYIYQAGDKKVLRGEYKIGDQCNATARNAEKTNSLCGGHFRKWNKINNPQVNAEIASKQSESLRASRRAVEQKNKDIVENSNNILTETAQEILQVLGKNEKYDLVYEYSLLKRLNANPQQESYSEKFAFAMWLNTPEHSRTPKTIEEVPDILGVQLVTLSLWRRSPELVRIMNNKARESFCRAYGYITEKLLERVAGGSEKAMDVGLKHIKEIEAEIGANSRSTPAAPKLLDEAKKINESGIDRFVGVANQVKKIANYDALINGNVKPNDTVQ